MTPRMLAAAAVALFASVGSASATKIVVLDFNHAEKRHLIPYQAIADTLKEEGFRDATLVVEDAGGKKDKAAELSRKLAQDKSVDLYMALGTSAAVPLAKEVKDRPLVFGMVFNPIESHIAKDWASSGNNTTGASDYVSLTAFLTRLVKRAKLPVKKIGMLYSPGEKNTEVELADVQAAAKDLGIDVEAVAVPDEAALSKWAGSLKRGQYDLVVLSGANVINHDVAVAAGALARAKIMSVTHLEDLVERGVLLGLVADMREVGRLAGKAAARVLRGEAPSAIRIEYPLPKLIINEKAVAAGGFEIPPSLREWAGAR